MSNPLFFVDDVPSEGHVRLSGAEGRHAVTVKRLAVGEHVSVADGRGRVAHGQVSEVIGRDELVVAIQEVEQVTEPVPALTVVQALAKGERADLAVELMTELGVDRIIPWSAARSIAQWKGDKADRGADKWRTTAREAAKQSRRARVPIVEEPVTSSQISARIADGSPGSLTLVLHEGAQTSLIAEVRSAQPIQNEVTLIVGPEGGISPEELEEFVAAGAVAVRLGREVLRTSTAGGAACAAISPLIGRW